MIICPNCQHENIQGAVFCGECGSRLVAISRYATQTLGAIEGNSVTEAPAAPPPVDNVGSISLHLMETGQVLSLAGRNEFTLGRMTEGQPILPDVDLTQYDAFSRGVSRLHAALRLNNQKLVVIDLGSSNGTRVNGQKILPHLEYPLNHGDILALGKLKIQVLFQK